MAQLAIYIDDSLAGKLDRAARQAGMSRSRLVANLLEAYFADRLPEDFLAVLGTWDDERSADEIVADIRAAGADASRADLE